MQRVWAASRWRRLSFLLSVFRLFDVMAHGIVGKPGTKKPRTMPGLLPVRDLLDQNQYFATSGAPPTLNR